ncbi:MerR family transcriptional regulator [Nonomuraea sp. NPDC004297]
MEWSIQEIARLTGTTSRTLRHYGELGLLMPSRVGSNGYRYYDQEALVRLQRILLLRELGVALPAIAQVLEGRQNTSAALRTHLRLLEQELERIRRQIASVRTTLVRTEKGEPLVAAEVFDGFDHTRYKEEVTERWGREAYEKGDRWWGSLSAQEKRAFQNRQEQIARDFGQALKDGHAVDGDVAQAIAQRHREWLMVSQASGQKSYVIGLAEMYVADPHFAETYERHGQGTAAFVRDAMKVYAERHLSDG